jgi:protein-S-isoprenylcysteine O-methyltransferase Ste14
MKFDSTDLQEYLKKKENYLYLGLILVVVGLALLYIWQVIVALGIASIIIYFALRFFEEKDEKKKV